MPGIEWDREGRSPAWTRYRITDGKDGAYSLQFSEPYPKYLVRIEADGYLPGVSRSFSADEGRATFDFELTPGTGPNGVVLDHEGNPVQGAEVFYEMLQDRQSGPSPFVTNKKGQFSFLGLKGGSG